MMKIKEFIAQSYDDLKNLTINWFNILMLAIFVILLSSFTTPIIGVPAGLLGGAYYLKRREEKDQ